MGNPYWVRAYEAEHGSGMIAGYAVERAKEGGAIEVDSDHAIDPPGDAAARAAALIAAEARRDQLNCEEDHASA